MIERGSVVPSSMPRRVDSEPAATLRTTISSGNDLDFADELFAHVHAANEVRGHSDVIQAREDIFRDPVVQDPLPVDDVMLLVVESSGIILEVLDKRAGSGPSYRTFALPS